MRNPSLKWKANGPCGDLHEPCPAPEDIVADNSYRDVLGDLAWRRLHADIRTRFSSKPAAGRTVRYVGVMSVVELSFMGWLFAQFCRLIGTPLAPYRGRGVKMDIRLAPDTAIGGVAWTRRYLFADRAPLEVRSTKRRSGAQELTEHIGCGFAMRLRLSERNGNLYFVSHAYEWSAFGLTLRIPNWLTPGTTTVSHENLRSDLFRFTLAVEHPWFGRTIYQDGYFEPARAWQ